MRRIIVTRFSAMGDVAMVASVLKEFQKQYQDTEIIMVSRKPFKAFFEDIPRIIFHAIEPYGIHNGFWGIFRLFRELKRYKADYLADLHRNIRSNTLNTMFSLAGYRVKVIDKGRDEKKALVRKQDKVFKPLQHTTERYADVFRSLGFAFTLPHLLLKEDRPIPEALKTEFLSTEKKIGIAPFAQHPYKVFPIQKMEEVIQYLSSQGHQIYIFGGGDFEKKTGTDWSKNYPGVINTIGQFTLGEELNMISNLDLMVSMDSSGMHMASLVGTRCISIWGATHPFTGFLGYGQSLDDCVQVDHPNRPSSIYGNKPCDCDGIEAIDLVTSEMVIDKVRDALKL